MKTIDEYISNFPPEVRHILENIRAIIKSNAPRAEETISYQMPTFKMNGNLIHFAAYKNHIGIYPTPSGVKEFQDKIQPYKFAKGSIRLPLDQPIPYDLVAEIVRFRVSEKTGQRII